LWPLRSQCQAPKAGRRNTRRLPCPHHDCQPTFLLALSTSLSLTHRRVGSLGLPMTHAAFFLEALDLWCVWTAAWLVAGTQVACRRMKPGGSRSWEGEKARGRRRTTNLGGQSGSILVVLPRCPPSPDFDAVSLHRTSYDGGLTASLSPSPLP
jgi:hypothetical protein